MSWDSSTRRTRLPSDWRQRRATVIHRDPTCKLRYDGCTLISTEADHIGDDTDHRLTMLRGACKHCHAKRTAEQGLAARGLGPTRLRPTDSHPGAIQ